MAGLPEPDGEAPTPGPGGTRDSPPHSPRSPSPGPALTVPSRRRGPRRRAGSGRSLRPRQPEPERQRPGERRLPETRRSATRGLVTCAEAARRGEGPRRGAGEGEGVHGWGRDRGRGRDRGPGRGSGPVEGWAALACLASRPLGRAPAARPPPLSPWSAEAGPWGEGVEGGCQTRVHNGMNEGLPLTPCAQRTGQLASSATLCFQSVISAREWPWVSRNAFGCLKSVCIDTHACVVSDFCSV